MPRLLSISSIVNAPHAKYNHYVSGSGVTANTTSNHRVKNRKASKKIPPPIPLNDEYDLTSSWPQLGGLSTLNQRASNVATRDTTGSSISIKWQSDQTSPNIVCTSSPIIARDNSIVYTLFNALDPDTHLPSQGYLVGNSVSTGQTYIVWGGLPASEEGFYGASTPAIGSTGEILYLVGAKGTLFALNVGVAYIPRIVFQKNYLGAVGTTHASASPVLDSRGQVLYGSTEGKFVSVHATTGDLLWMKNFNSFSTIGQYHNVQNMCAVSGAAAGTIFVVSVTPGYSRQGYLWALNPSTGALVWGVTGSGTTGYFETAGFIQSAPVLSSDSSVVYIVVQDLDSNTYLVAINAANGAIVWNTHLSRSFVYQQNSVSISPVDGSIFLLTNVTEEFTELPFAFLCCFNRSDGSLKWSPRKLSGNEMGGPVTTATDVSPCCDSFGNCIVTYFDVRVNNESPSGYSYVAKVSGSTGAVLWTSRLDYVGLSMSSPSIAGDGSIIVPTQTVTNNSSRILSFI